MKRFLSIILAIAMVISMIPAAFASGEMGKAGISIQYDTYSGSNTSGFSDASLIDYTRSNGRIEYFGTTSTAKYPYSWDQTAKNTMGEGTFRFIAAFVLTAGSNEYTAYKIRIPEKGDYITSLYYLACANDDAARNGSLYILPYKEGMDIASELSNENLVLPNVDFYNETNKFKTTEEVSFTATTAGEYLMVWKNTGDTGTRITPVRLTLNGGDGKTPICADVNVVDEELDAGTKETTEITLSNVFMSDGNAATTEDTQNVTYTSTNKNVATVSENVVTAKMAGKTTIRAMVGEYVLGEKEIEVINTNLSGISIQYDTYAGTNADGFSDASMINYTRNNGRIEYFGTTSTAKYPYSWDQTAKNTMSEGIYRFIAAFVLTAGSDEYTAYKIRVPEKGDYITSLYYLACANDDAARSGSLYILPYKEGMDIASELSNENLVLPNVDFYNETNKFKTTEEVNFSAENAGEYIMVWKNTGDTGTRITPVRLTLNGGTGTAPIWADMSVENAELEVSGTTTLTSTVYTSDGKTATDTTEISYTSTDIGVATISGTTVEANGAGTAKIQAKSGDYVLGEVAVMVNTPEYTAAFKPDDTQTEVITASVVTLVYPTNLEVTCSAEENATEGTWYVKTEETVNDYTFRYWVRGLEDGTKKRIVSLENEFDYAPQNGANYLIAVYTKDGEEATADEYYNANGQLIATGAEPELPYMVGYGKATEWISRGNGVFEAAYGSVQSYTITVNGKENTYNYGDPVRCVAASEENGQKFFGWTKQGEDDENPVLVSADTSYTFYAWEDCEVTAVYKNEEPVFAGEKRKILLDTITLGSDTAIMAEFIGFGDAVERGIILGTKSYAMTKKAATQFTIVNDEKAANISGYAILADGTKVIYNK